MATAPATAKAAAPPQPLPWRVGTQFSDLQDYQPPAVTLGTGTQTLPVYHPTADSFQRGVWVQVGITYPSNVVATLVQKQDAPFNIINTISLTDTQQRFIFGPVGGIDLYFVNLLGGYFFQNDPKASAAYSNPITSTPLAAQFALYLPLEIDMRDGLGSLENKNQAATFNVNVTVETLANVFGTGPTNAPLVQFTFTSDSYLQPAAADAQGNPLAQSPQALGTTQFWSKTSFQMNAGSNPNQYFNGGIGFPIRNIVFENYDVASGLRSTGETNWPTPLTLVYKGVTLFNRNKVIWQEKMARAYGLTSLGAGVAEPANSKPAGVYNLPFNMDFTNQPGSELRNGYLQTVPGTQLLGTGSWALASTTYELVNYVAPANGNPGSIRAGGR
jgi:hypothetical protein